MANYDEKQEVNSAREVIETAQLRVAQLRTQYLRSAAHGTANDAELRADFHAAVMEYYLALRPYRDEGALGERWKDAILWERADGSKVRGFDTLGGWINRQKQVAAGSNSRGQAQQRDTRPEHLPPEKLIRVSSALDDIAKTLGISVSVDSGQRPAGLLEETTADDDRAAADGGTAE
jgi:hypothetical protein